MTIENMTFAVQRGDTAYSCVGSELKDKLASGDLIPVSRNGELHQFETVFSPPPWEGAAAIYHVIVSNFSDIKITNQSKIYNLANQTEVSSINAAGEWVITGVNTKFLYSTGNWDFGALTDTSNVTNMVGMFNNAPVFNSDISNWDVSNVTNMRYMFESALAFNSNISNWNVSNVTCMNYMFNNAQVFNQNLTSWCVTKITSEPNSFRRNSSMPTDGSYDPKWGTCP